MKLFLFVHTQGRPDSISETEFEEEHKIFRKSYSFKRDGFDKFRKEISAELERIGELAGFIIEDSKQDKKGPDLSALEDLFDTSFTLPRKGNGFHDPGFICLVWFFGDRPMIKNWRAVGVGILYGL